MKPVAADEAAGSHPAGDPRPVRSSDTAGMWTSGSLRTEEAVISGTVERGARLPPGDTLARPEPSAAGSGLVDSVSVGVLRVDGASSGLAPIVPPPDLLAGAASVEEQLRRLEVRLLAEAGGDPAVERDVRRHFAESCARFETARVRTFLPILVEREVRRRLRDRERPA
jgi:hypothetical protein